jgi:hypothetical protein
VAAPMLIYFKLRSDSMFKDKDEAKPGNSKAPATPAV